MSHLYSFLFIYYNVDIDILVRGPWLKVSAVLILEPIFTHLLLNTFKSQGIFYDIFDGF